MGYARPFTTPPALKYSSRVLLHTVVTEVSSEASFHNVVTEDSSDGFLASSFLLSTTSDSSPYSSLTTIPVSTYSLTVSPLFFVKRGTYGQRSNDQLTCGCSHRSLAPSPVHSLGRGLFFIAFRFRQRHILWCSFSTLTAIGTLLALLLST